MLYELTCKKQFFSPIRRIRKYLFFHGFVDLELSFVCDFWMSKCRESLGVDVLCLLLLHS
jgi:hypothetical protein